MAIRVKTPRTQWWMRYAKRTHRSAPELSDILQPAAETPQRFPHVRIRLVNKEPEAFISGSGLFIWEIAWLARSYDGDVQAVARHTLADPILIEEGMCYAAERAVEVDAEIRRHTEVSLEELQALLPGIQVISVDIGDDDRRME